MSSDPQARRKCTKRWEEDGETKVELNKRKKRDNMASGPGWRSKLWIGVNGEPLIGTELLCLSRDPFEHSLTQRHI